MKWLIFRDSLTKNYTDGAMIRVMMPIGGAYEIQKADERAADFIGAVERQLYCTSRRRRRWPLSSGEPARWLSFVRGDTARSTGRLR